MAAFGLGTLPAMIGIGVSGRGLAALRRPAMRKLLGVTLIVSAFWVAAMPASRLLAPDAMQHHADAAVRSLPGIDALPVPSITR